MAILLNPHLSALGASQLPWYSNMLRDELAESTGATKVGTSDGRTVEQRLAALPNEVESTREAMIAMAASLVLTQSIIAAHHAFV